MMMILESVVQVAPVMTAHTAPASFGKSVPVCVTGSTDRSGVGFENTVSQRRRTLSSLTSSMVKSSIIASSIFSSRSVISMTLRRGSFDDGPGTHSTPESSLPLSTESSSRSAVISMTSYSDSLDGLGTQSTPESSLSLSMIMTFDDVSRGGVGRTGSLVVEDDAEDDDDEYQLSGLFFLKSYRCVEPTRTYLVG